MSMLKYRLYEFIYQVPSCLETTTLEMMLEVCQQQDYQRLVVVNEQESPLGFFYPSRLLPQLLAAKQGDITSNQSGSCLDRKQPVASLADLCIEPIATLSANFSLEEFGRHLSTQALTEQQVVDWALLDSDGKFIGLLNSSQLLQVLIQELVTIPQTQQSQPQKTPPQGAEETTDWLPEPEAGSPYPKAYSSQQRLDAVVRVLEKLPLPLRLQTAKGRVVTQNQAWGRLLGSLNDSLGLAQQVQSIFTQTRESKPNQPGTIHQHSNNSPYVNPPNDRVAGELPIEVQVHTAINTLLIGNPGLSEGSLPPRPSTITPANTSEVTAPLSRCYLDGQENSCICVVQVPNAQERVWKFAKIPLENAHKYILSNSDSETDTDLWLLLANDVTEQHHLCKELAAKNADLIQLNRLKDEFLACISHELKTPLTAVLGLSSLLKDRMLGDLNERQARYAGLIHQSGRHLMSVVNDILDLTRMETGQMELNLSPVNLRSVCDRALAEAKTMQANHTKATRDATLPEQCFTLSIEPGLEQIVADELRLRQMLVHLLANAFKFTQPEDEIGLLVSRWEGWIAFTVWDTGIGIPEHQQHLIFQKFQQLENPMTRQFEGTGLGLVLTRALARLHGGDVSFLSKEGKGSHFTLLLPPSPPLKGLLSTELDPDQENFPPVLSGFKSNPTSYPNRLVLVVEAVAQYIENLTEQLTGLGYRVVIARSGCEALEKARRLQPKVIFLNPLLPLLSGWDVLTLLKSDAGLNIPVIVTGTSAQKEQAFAHCAEGFVTLPVQPQVLQPLLTKLSAPEPITDTANNINQGSQTITQMRILRLLDDHASSPTPHPGLQHHRVLEADDLDQAELLARVWQLDVVMLDVVLHDPLPYLQKLSQYPCLASLPIVTCDVATTQAASQVSGLSVFPWLTSATQNKSESHRQGDTLLSVLQIAAGISCPPSLLLIDFATLTDLTPDSTSATYSPPLKGSEWFPALIQYLHTAGFKAAMGRTWAEVLQQIQHHSVDLVLIPLTESTNPAVLSALSTLAELSENLPPILVLDRRLAQPAKGKQTKKDPAKQDTANAMETYLRAIATQILPPSLSMQELLEQIHSVLSPS
ncbi:MAG: hybrid sensor histidine kinase/response regulator [Nostocaceae cyanobacterium]|nr:hybrid sensor histidine kinase/response regulator [Nostocaceae cyanobacterium]